MFARFLTKDEKPEDQGSGRKIPSGFEKLLKRSKKGVSKEAKENKEEGKESKEEKETKEAETETKEEETTKEEKAGYSKKVHN